MPQFRTKDELKRAQWAEKFLSVADGEQYVTDEHGSENSPFPLHEYFKNRLLGRKVKMLEVNAGLALVENMVADAMTEMHVSVKDEGGEEDEDAAQEVWNWLDSIDYETKDEEACRDFFAVGYDVQQPVRTLEGDENAYTVANVDPGTWYPTLPVFTYQPVAEGRIVSVFCEESGGSKTWYAFVERHTVGNVAYGLYELERPDATEGKKVPLTTLERFKGLKDAATDLPFLAVLQQNRQKSSRHLFGRSVLAPIWDILQEVSEIQTQIRHERIKHFRAKLYAPSRSLQRAENANPEQLMHPLNSKQLAKAYGAHFDLNQEIFPVPEGSTVVPGYIQRDLQTITLGSIEIDKLLSRAAAIVGAPKGVFNLEDKSGNVKVDTERRKDRRYVRQIVQAQKRRCASAQQLIRAWWIWTKGEEPPQILVTRQPPFQMSQEEVVTMMREMNPDDRFVSGKEARKQIWADKTPEELEELEKEIEEEDTLREPPPGSALNNINPVQL